MKTMMLRRNTGPKTGKHIVRACAVETHMDMSQEPYCIDISKKNAGTQSRDTRFVRACAIETHMERHKSHLVWKSTGKMLDALEETTSIEHRAFVVTVGNAVVATLFGE